MLARGFPWSITHSDVEAFFRDVNILGGKNGIVIRRNVAMEALFAVDTTEDLQKALAHDKQSVNSRSIHGKYQVVIISLHTFDFQLVCVVFQFRRSNHIQQKFSIQQSIHSKRQVVYFDECGIDSMSTLILRPKEVQMSKEVFTEIA